MARALESSYRQPPLGCVDATTDVPWSDGALCDLTLYLRPSGGERAVVDAAEEHVRRRLAGQDAPFLSREGAADLASADPAEVQAVVSALKRAGVEHVHPVGLRAVHVQGRWEQLGGLIDVARMRYRTDDGVVVGRAGAISLGDPALDPVVGVFGLDNRRALSSYVIKSHVIKSHVIKSHVIKSHVDPGVIKSHADRTVIKSHVIKSHVIKSHVIKSHGDLGAEMDEAMADDEREWAVPDEVADWYDFPAGTGKGVSVAVLAFSGSLGGTDQVVMGGYDVEELTEFWRKELRQTASPTLQDKVVRGPGNWPSGGDVDGTDFTDEVMLDLSVVGALAPEADITVWFTEPTEQGFVDALHAVAEEAKAPDVLVICYGAPEDKGSGTSWTRMATEQADQALALAALRGTTVVVSCGDNGAAGLPLSTRVHADYPSSSAWVLGVGGTRRRPDNAGLDRERVWNDGLAASGGGISAVTPRPEWQTVEVPEPVDAWERPDFRGRGVPDVAAVADLATGVAVLDAAGNTVMGGGTSVAAPVWAALLARCRERAGERLGFVTPLLYAARGAGVRDVPMGDNGAYAARRGAWDPCTGLGVPDGRTVLDALRPGSPDASA